MSNEHEPAAGGVRIPHQSLSDAALRGIIEEFVLREGTEYGEQDVSLAEKVSRVMEQLESGEVGVVFDSQSESVDIATAERLAELGGG